MAILGYSTNLVADQPNPKVYFGDSLPSASTGFSVGDILVNTAPGLGETVAWVLTNVTNNVWTPLSPLGSLAGTPQALTAAGTVTGTPGLVTASGFAGSVTLASPTAFANGFQLAALALSTHSVTLVAPSGSAIVGLNGAITSATAGAVLVAGGVGNTNWYRIS